MLFLLELPTAISNLKTAQEGWIVGKKYESVSDDTLNTLLMKKLDNGQDNTGFHRLIEPFNDKCVPLLVQTPYQQD